MSYNKIGLVLTTILFLSSFNAWAGVTIPPPSSNSQFCTDAFRTDPTVCLDGVGAGTYGTDNVRLTATSFSAATSSASNDDDIQTSQRIGESNLSGIPAGDHFSGWGFWASFNNTEFDGSLALAGNANISRVGYDGDIKTLLFGADKLVTDKLILGLAIGYEESDVFTLYNGGNNESDGFTVVPYAAYLLSDFVSIDAAVGYTQLEYDTDRVSIASAGTRNIGSYDSDRWFASINLNATGNIGNFLMTARAGYLYTEEDQDAYQETGGADARTVSDRKLDLSQIQLGVEVAYQGVFMPFLGLTWANDIDRETGGNGLSPGLPGGNQVIFEDSNEMQLGFGLRHYGDVVSLVLDVNTVLERDSFDSHSVMFTLRSDL